MPEFHYMLHNNQKAPPEGALFPCYTEKQWSEEAPGSDAHPPPTQVVKKRETVPRIC